MKIITCKICRKEFKSLKALTSHLRIHNIKSKEYYDKYIKNDGDDICLNYGNYKGCNQYTKWVNLVVGHHKYCSVKCMCNSSKFKDKSSKNKLGDKHWLNQPNSVHPNKGKTYEQQFGFDKANKLKSNLSKRGKKLIGDKNPFYGKKHSEESLLKARNTCMVKYGTPCYQKTSEFRNNQRDYMLNGGFLAARAGVTKISKPQLKLFKIISNYFNDTKLEYPCLNFSIDIAIPSEMIAIEYDDSYWHQDKQYDKKRQLLIENEGWKVIRFIDNIPNINEIIQKVISIV